MSIPSATYRLQLHAGFNFRDATAIIDYLHDLGVTDLYSSPYFRASATSTHGYDVADHNHINPAIGSTVDFQNMIAALKARSMGHLLDFVPNHMGIGEALNTWWMDLLEDGRESIYSDYFDIDWRSDKKALEGKIVLPTLGEHYGKVLEKGDFKLSYEKGRFYLHYFENVLPLHPDSYATLLRDTLPSLKEEEVAQVREVLVMFDGLPCRANEGDSPREDRRAAKDSARRKLDTLTQSHPSVLHAIEEVIRRYEGTPGQPESFDALHELLENQVYRLCYWRLGAEEINYRRFFDINTLAALRVEIPEVFEASHQLVFEMMDRGDVTGLRIDHIDGLRNPKEYLERLQARHGNEKSRPLYVLVEKILDPFHEKLAPDWPVFGTTGYEFANQAVHLFVDPSGEPLLTRTYKDFSGETERFDELVYRCKRMVTEISFLSEVAALGRLADQISEYHRLYRDFTSGVLTIALRELIACFPVYRTYVSETHDPDAQEEGEILRAILLARRRNPSIDKPVFDFLRDLLLKRFPESLTPSQKEECLNFVMTFQQYTGPVMAKGLEDTALYRYHRLVALNEVGGHPGVFGIRTADFHRFSQERQTGCMLTTSTHDTKRSEDVRMRIAAISEFPAHWRRLVRRWHRMNRRYLTQVEGEGAPSPNEEYLLYQTLLGAWPLEPLSPEGHEEFVARIQDYMLKAIKEGKANSSWIQPNEEWEQAVRDFVAQILDPRRNRAFHRAFQPFAEQIALVGAWNSLSQLVLKCTLPGVPDTYQGTELWDFSLVDPDNRRPVNFELRRRHLASLEGSSIEELVNDWKSGRIKLFVLRTLLRFRRDHPEFFQSADYVPCETGGEFGENVIAFCRRLGGKEMRVFISRWTSRVGTIPIGELWKDTAVSADHAGPWKDLLSGAIISAADGRLWMREVFAALPFAVLVRQSER